MFTFNAWSFFFLIIAIINITTNPWWFGVGSILIFVLSIYELKPEVAEKIVEPVIDHQAILDARCHEYLVGNHW